MPFPALKTVGYLISTLSVVLLAFAAWESASRHVLTQSALVLGALCSIAGMGCRWWTYMCEHQRQLRTLGKENEVPSLGELKAAVGSRRVVGSAQRADPHQADHVRHH